MPRGGERREEGGGRGEGRYMVGWVVWDFGLGMGWCWVKGGYMEKGEGKEGMLNRGI